MDNKNKNISTLDIPQMQRMTYDEHLEANRVVLVGSDLAGFKNELKESISEALKGIKLPEIQTQVVERPLTDEKPFVLTTKEIEYREIEKPIIVTEREVEYREIEKPIIVKEVVVETVEVPFIITKIEYREIDKPIIVKEFIPIPNWIKYLLIAQTIALVAILILRK